MKKYLSLLVALLICMSFTACGNSGPAEETKQPPSLIGEWKQINSQSEDSYQSAIITADTIEVYWISDGGDTKSLYWAGSFSAPTTTEDAFILTSENDREKTDSAILASTSDIKEFTFSNGQISYEVSALGTTTTVRMEKQE